MRTSRAILTAFVIAATTFGGAACRRSASKPESGAAAQGQKKALYWYDPMKPEVHFDHPGKSPFMDMQLEPKYSEEPPPAGAAAPPGLSVVRIPLERRQEIGVTTAKVEKRTIGEAIETNGV